MKLDLTKPVQTKSGKPVTILNTQARGLQPIIGQTSDDESVEKWHLDGTYYREKGTPSCLDLINTPEKRTVEFWVNVYPDYVGQAHSLKSSADRAGGSRIACLHIVEEFTVGEGL